MLERGKMDRGVLEIVDTESLVPSEHLLRKIDAAVDFNRLYEMVEPLYCEDNGRPSIDPVILFKMVLIQHLYGLPSLRRTAEEVSLNIAYRWFLGYTLQEETPHFSTVSYNFWHRFTEETVDRIFRWILEEVAEAGYLSPKAVFTCVTPGPGKTAANHASAREGAPARPHGRHCVRRKKASPQRLAFFILSILSRSIQAERCAAVYFSKRRTFQDRGFKVAVTTPCSSLADCPTAGAMVSGASQVLRASMSGVHSSRCSTKR